MTYLDLILLLSSFCILKPTFGHPRNVDNFSISFPEPTSQDPNPIKPNHFNSTEVERPNSNHREPERVQIHFGKNKNQDSCKDCNNENNLSDKAPNNTSNQDVSATNATKQIEFIRNDPPPCDAGNGYCVNDPEYEEFASKRFKELLKNSTLSNMLIDLISEPKSNAFEISQRTGDSVLGEPLCKSISTTITPQRAKNLEKQWVFILNQEEIRQEVQVELCEQNDRTNNFGFGGEERSKCFVEEVNQHALGRASCKQKFLYKHLLTMDETGSRISVQYVYLPACCVCYTSPPI